MVGSLNINAQGVCSSLTMKQNKHSWSIKDLSSIQQTGRTVFSTFCCGGGSSMGYKFAGFKIVAANDIDPQMKKHYEMNFNVPNFYLCSIKELISMPLPEELFNLDILDGSPPCSSFSMSGDREKSWGKEKFFREGQSKQILDDLFFDFIALANRLQPKIIVAENVKGLIAGNAKGYLKLIKEQLNDSGYDVQIILLNAAFCDVAQTRERVFIIGRRKDLNLKPIQIVSPNNKALTIIEVLNDLEIKNKKFIGEDSKQFALWNESAQGEGFAKAHLRLYKKNSHWNFSRLHPNKPSPTMTSQNYRVHWDEPRYLTKEEIVRIASFPDDYQFDSTGMAQYLCGMSVPPKMMKVIAKAIRQQWFDGMD